MAGVAHLPVRTDVEPTHISMHLLNPLPPVCSRHGEPEVERRDTTISFHWHNRVRVQTTMGSTLARGWQRLQRVPQTTATELYGEWPVCARCIGQRRILRATSLTLVAAGLVPLLGLLTAGYLGLITGPLSPLLALAFMPGWFPGLLIIAYAAHERATRYVRIQPIESDSVIVIRGHPAFVAAVHSGSN